MHVHVFFSIQYQKKISYLLAGLRRISGICPNTGRISGKYLVEIPGIRPDITFKLSPSTKVEHPVAGYPANSISVNGPNLQ